MSTPTSPDLVSSPPHSQTFGAARQMVPNRPLLELVGADLEVPLVQGGSHRYVNLDLAASAPALSAVGDAVASIVPWYSSVHRGAGFPSRVSSEVVERARDEVRSFLGARSDDVVIFTRNTTDSLNLLARALPPDTEVFTLDIEHHANLLPWRRGRVRHLPTPSSVDDIADTFDAALRTSSARHRVVALTGASNVTGEVLPIAQVAEVARKHDARLVLDAAQLAPHRAIDISALGVDYVAFSGHKLYAPFGAGVLVGRADWLDAAPPHLDGGGALQVAGLEDVQWSQSPARHEAGTPNVVGATAIATACQVLSTVGFRRVAEHDDALLTHLRHRLATIDRVRLVSAFGHASDRVGIATLELPISAALVAAALSAEYGIGTRDGAFCAHPLMRRLFGAAESDAVPNALRLSFGVGTTALDIDYFADSLREVITSGVRWIYELDRGRLSPAPDPRRWPLSGDRR